MEGQKELQSEFRRQQEKYTYYVIALCVTAIGYSVNITLGHSLKPSHIILGLAIMSWAISVFLGLKVARHVLHSLFMNNMYMDVLQGVHPLSGTHPEKIEIISKEVMKTINATTDSAGSLALWQNRLFFIGITLFIVWHVWEMSLL